MEKSKKLNLLGQLLLLLATLVWGTSFVILKDTIGTVPPMFVIAIRFISAGVILLLVFFKKMKKATKRSILAGLVVGLFLASAYVSQTYGLLYTTPGKNAFLTSTYCVMCPFMLWILFKNKPKLKNVISAVICIIGIGFISLSGNNQAGEGNLLGDALTLLSAVFFGFQIVYISHFQSRGEDTITLLVTEFLSAGLIFALITLIFEMPVYGVSAYAIDGQNLFNIIYLTLMCTLFAQSAQMIGQRYTAPNQSSLILSLESVFGMLFSVIMGVEKLSFMLCIGFSIVFISILISELSFSKNNKINIENTEE